MIVDVEKQTVEIVVAESIVDARRKDEMAVESIAELYARERSAIECGETCAHAESLGALGNVGGRCRDGHSHDGDEYGKQFFHYIRSVEDVF